MQKCRPSGLQRGVRRGKKGELYNFPLKYVVMNFSSGVGPGHQRTSARHLNDFWWSSISYFLAKNIGVNTGVGGRGLSNFGQGSRVVVGMSRGGSWNIICYYFIVDSKYRPYTWEHWKVVTYEEKQNN